MAATRGSETTRAFRPAPFFDHGLFLLHLNRGKEEMARGYHETARREFEEARRLRPRDAEVLLNLSITLFHLGQYDEAEVMTRDLLTEHAESVPLLFNLGLILFKSGRDGEAREPLEKVLAFAPAHRKAHLTLGLVAQRRGAWDEAQRHFRMAGAELKDGAEGDDSVARTARAAAAEVRIATAKSASPADTRPSPTVKPEPLDSLTASGKNKISSGVRPRPSAAVLAGLETAAPAVARPLGPFSPKPGGFLSVSCGGGVRVRRGIVVGRSGSPVIDSSPAATPDGLDRILVGASGEGILLVADPGRVPWLKALANEALSVHPERLLAFESALACRADVTPDAGDRTAPPFLKLSGTGAVALAVSSEPARFEIAQGQPLAIAARAVVGYGGDVLPELLAESDPLSGLGAGASMRFSGAGFVLADAR
ncbi:MAG TPA: tetratricopeptide repeat protein [Thermoanaerobaculia bacterium]|nr:tetratricopeptide repeat protein [Thermoanaerobaculia bacterium]